MNSRSFDNDPQSPHNIVETLGVPDEMKQSYFNLLIMAGLKYCKYCHQNVSPMSKCTVEGKRTSYHSDLLREE